VIDVRMRQYHHIDAGGIEVRETAIDLVLVIPSPLVEPAVEKDLLSVHFQQMLGPRCRSGRAAEFEFHGKESTD
jgi:hypothetical protein